MNRSLTLPAAALAALALAAPAHAASPPPAGPPSTTHVEVAVSLQDASGAEVRSLRCDWTGSAADEDRECLRVLGDPQDEIALLEEAGADRSVVRVTTSDGLVRTAGFTRRADGTWLSRGEGTLAGGRSFSYGFVCSSSGAECVPWRASAKAARAAVRRADAKLRRR